MHKGVDLHVQRHILAWLMSCTENWTDTRLSGGIDL